MDKARRADLSVYFDGVDISSDIGQYLLSLDYTDSEEDLADDLRITLADRESIWLTNWLNSAIRNAAKNNDIPEDKTGLYIAASASGVNARSGAGTGFSILGVLPYGTSVKVTAYANGWATISYNGGTAYVESKYLAPADESNGANGLKIQAVIALKDMTPDGGGNIINCGQFELDDVEAAGPPSVITLKATALPFTAAIRQTKHTQAWERYRLSGIAKEITKRNGMGLLFEMDTDPYYERIEQRNKSDISFLSELCHNAGASLKVTNNILVVFSQELYEQKPSVKTITRGCGYEKYRLSSGTADKLYSSCRVSYTKPNGELIEGIAYVSDYDPKSSSNQQLEYFEKVNSIGEAQWLAANRLKLQNKYARTASFTFPLSPALYAGCVVTLSGWGYWDGKYIISEAKHSVKNTSTTSITLRRA